MGKVNSKNQRRNNKKGKKRQAVPTVKPTKNASATPVRPEVEYQEKSTVDIHPSHNSLPLSTPVKRTEDFAGKDNSVDGFLSIKH